MGRRSQKCHCFVVDRWVWFQNRNRRIHMEPNESGGRPWKRLTAERKFELYLATRAPEAPVGEILRKAGLSLEELREIEEMVAASAITGLKARSRSARYNKRTVTPEEYHQLSLELQQKEKALADLTVEHMMLKKKERLGLPIEDDSTFPPKSGWPSSKQSRKRKKRG